VSKLLYLIVSEVVTDEDGLNQTPIYIYYQKHNKLVRNQTDESKTKHLLKSWKDVLCVGRFSISHMLWRFVRRHTCPFSPPSILFPVILVFITTD